MVMSMAWRGIVTRGWRAVLIVALLAAAMAASTVVFSAADSFVFDRVPYPNAERLVLLQRTSAGREPSDYVQPELIAEWRKHTDIFSAVHAHDFLAPVYLTAGNVTESLRAQVVTPGLFEALGVRARWGRTLQPGDELPEREPVAVIAEELARRMFANPADALGQLLRVGTDAPRIVGVMPMEFRFPSSRERIWRPLDLARQPHNEYVRGLFLRASGVSREALARAVIDRLPTVARVATERPRKEHTEAITMISGETKTRSTLVFAMLMGAALSLLLIACANVAGLELAAAMARARTFAIHTALGASRAMLVRTAALEAGLLLAASTILAWLIASWGLGLLTTSLPPAMINDLTNSIDLDARALAFMGSIALVTWLITSLPVVVRATRSDLVEIMKEDHRAIRSPGTSMRQSLMAGQVALTVALLVAALLNIRTYTARLGLEKGFESTGLVGIQAVHTPASPAQPAELDATLLATLQTQPGVTSVARTGDLLPSTTSGISAPLSVAGRPTTQERIRLATSNVDPEYFRTVGIPMLAGRSFTAADPPGMLVVDESFARRYWPDGDALGARFTIGGAGFGGASTFEIVGVASPVRGDRAETIGGIEQFVVYGRISPEFIPLSYVVRLEHERQIGALTSLVREKAPGTIVRVEPIEDRYRRLFGDVRLAASITSGFGLLALIAAVTGVYGLMTFLVAGRTREIGVRLALGATPAEIGRMVLGTAARFIGAGGVLGLIVAVAGARYVESLLFGVSPTDPLTFAIVLTLVSCTALAATWLPARTASRVDPASALRAE